MYDAIIYEATYGRTLTIKWPHAAIWPLVPHPSPIHWTPHGARGLTVLNDETQCWLNDITASI